MKNLRKWAAALVIATLTLSTLGCTSETEYGKCVGMWQDDRRDPNLVYDLSMWNLVWGAIGAELILIPPALVLHHETFCPTGRRPAPMPTPSFGEPSTNALGETKLR